MYNFHLFCLDIYHSFNKKAIRYYNWAKTKATLDQMAARNFSCFTCFFLNYSLDENYTNGNFFIYFHSKKSF